MEASLLMLQSRNTGAGSLSADNVITWMCSVNPFANLRTLNLFHQGIRATSQN